MSERAAQLAQDLIDEYDERALAEATARADTFLDMGDAENHAIWCQVRARIKDLMPTARAATDPQ